MKCIKKSGDYRHVSDRDAEGLTRAGYGWEYCPKHEYKNWKKEKSGVEKGGKKKGGKKAAKKEVESEKIAEEKVG